MKLKNAVENPFLDKWILGMMIVSAIVFSGFSYFSLIDTQLSNLTQISENVVSTQCLDESCYKVSADSIPSMSFVLQREDVTNDNSIIHEEDFTNLQIPVNVPPKAPLISGNKVTLFAEKDSFIREGIQSSNTGSSVELRLMGTGSINNRVIISFSQEGLESALATKKLESATLQLYIKSNDGKWNDGQMVNIYRLETDWNEGVGVGNYDTNWSGVTWNCPSSTNCDVNWNGGYFSKSPTDSVFVSNQVQEGYWLKFDVTKDVSDFLSGTPNYGWIIIKSDEDSSGRINFSSRESQSNNPELVLVMSK
jgi:hypothetical protein